MPPWLLTVLEIAFALYVGIGVFLAVVCWHVTAGEKTTRLGRARASVFFLALWMPYMAWTIFLYFFEEYLPGD